MAQGNADIRALIVGDHAHGSRSFTATVLFLLQTHPSVSVCGPANSIKEIKSLITEFGINTLFFEEDYIASGTPPHSTDAWLDFIRSARKDFPHIVFGFVRETEDRANFVTSNSRFGHYFQARVQLHEDSDPRRVILSRTDYSSFDEMLSRVQDWHVNAYQYDYVMSFASEDAKFADAMFIALIKGGAKVFSYARVQGTLIGRDLHTVTFDEYFRNARFCLAIVSDAYLEKKWTRRELAIAKHRSDEFGDGYLIVLKHQCTKMPSELDGIIRLSSSSGLSSCANVLLSKTKQAKGKQLWRRFIKWPLAGKQLKSENHRARLVNMTYGSGAYIRTALDSISRRFQGDASRPTHEVVRRVK